MSLCIWLINEEWHVWKQVYGSWWKNSCVFQVTIRLFYECFFLDAWLQTLLHYFAHTWPAFHSNLFILWFAFTQSWAVNLIYVDKIKYRNERHIPQIVLRFILSNKLSCQINKKKKKILERDKRKYWPRNFFFCNNLCRRIDNNFFQIFESSVNWSLGF